MKYSFREDRKATIAADWVVESVAGAGRRALRRHGETERCVSIVSWPDRIELALRTAAGTAYAMLPGGPAGTMCSESLWVANPELPLLCLPGPYQNVGAQEGQRAFLPGVRATWQGHRLMAPAVGRFQLPLTGWKSHNPPGDALPSAREIPRRLDVDRGLTCG